MTVGDLKVDVNYGAAVTEVSVSSYMTTYTVSRYVRETLTDGVDTIYGLHVQARVYERC